MKQQDVFFYGPPRCFEDTLNWSYQDSLRMFRQGHRLRLEIEYYYLRGRLKGGLIRGYDEIAEIGRRILGE